jgi:hypothetical protein
MPGRFGEDFDFNAQILRNAPLNRWLTISFGTLQSATDADRDGVPDNDPSLPFDEQRLGGSPALRDTDHDGLSDLEEILAGSSRGSSLGVRDTDSDGVIDGDDSEPLYPIRTHRERLGEQLPWDFGVIRGETYDARLSLAWTGQKLVLACEAPVPIGLLFQIDADNDGWFHGFDNVQIRLQATADSVRVLEYYLRDCSSWVDPPQDRRDLLRPEDLRCTVQPVPDSDLYQIVVSVPRLESYGLSLQRGQAIAVRIGTQMVSDRWVWDELFERNYMMPLILQ